mmetsp:Transcript_30205/g.98741  ORF Transcript_30205/g.98741 Transcript_30205/m.98741 type:complete len:309 (+) Transcript_30205:468-1394(+)
MEVGKVVWNAPAQSFARGVHDLLVLRPLLVRLQQRLPEVNGRVSFDVLRHRDHLQAGVSLVAEVGNRLQEHKALVLGGEHLHQALAEVLDFLPRVVIAQDQRRHVIEGRDDTVAWDERVGCEGEVRAVPRGYDKAVAEARVVAHAERAAGRDGVQATLRLLSTLRVNALLAHGCEPRLSVLQQRHVRLLLLVASCARGVGRLEAAAAVHDVASHRLVHRPWPFSPLLVHHSLQLCCRQAATPRALLGTARPSTCSELGSVLSEEASTLAVRRHELRAILSLAAARAGAEIVTFQPCWPLAERPQRTPT